LYISAISLSMFFAYFQKIGLKRKYAKIGIRRKVGNPTAQCDSQFGVSPHWINVIVTMEKIEEQIESVQKKIDQCMDPEEKKLLMKKEEQLREERLILLRRGEGNAFFLSSFTTISSKFLYFTLSSLLSMWLDHSTCLLPQRLLQGLFLQVIFFLNCFCFVLTLPFIPMLPFI